MMDLRDIHTPVSLDRCLELLTPALTGESAVLVDATLGMGGHSEAFLTSIPGLRVIGIDRDQQALDVARARLEKFAERVTFVHGIYDRITEILSDLGFARVNGFLFDLGVSSLQLDRVERGFSYSMDAPLDMRMDQTTGEMAADVLRTRTADELTSIFRRFGEEKLAARYARAICDERREHPVRTSGQLVEILQRATPAALRNAGHPAKRVFQALRIEVNEELRILGDALPQALDATTVGGRVVVMSYQSLEDRLVKTVFSQVSRDSTPVEMPVGLSTHAPTFRMLTRGAERASSGEREQNPRSTSVRIRAVERIREAA